MNFGGQQRSTGNYYNQVQGKYYHQNNNGYNPQPYQQNPPSGAFFNNNNNYPAQQQLPPLPNNPRFQNYFNNHSLPLYHMGRLLEIST